MARRDNYRLRPITIADVGFVLAWRNSDRVRANMYTDHIISEEEHRAWFERLQKSAFPSFMIFEEKSRPIGVTAFTAIDTYNSRCSWGFYLGETDLPSGTGSIMGFFALEYIFERYGFHKICAEAFSFNEASVKFHKKLGFSQEGFLREHVLKDNVFQDIVVFGYLKSDWLKKKVVLADALFGDY